jgi:hypothetical protein
MPRNTVEGVLRPTSNGGRVRFHHKSRMTKDEVSKLIGFINENHKQFPTNKDCFDAAVEAAGVQGRFKITSGAVCRYFAKAKAMNRQAAGKRPYTRRQHKPVEVQIHLNYCPNCRCDLRAVARGMAEATLTH